MPFLLDPRRSFWLPSRTMIGARGGIFLLGVAVATAAFSITALSDQTAPPRLTPSKVKITAATPPKAPKAPEVEKAQKTQKVEKTQKVPKVPKAAVKSPAKTAKSATKPAVKPEPKSKAAEKAKTPAKKPRVHRLTVTATAYNSVPEQTQGNPQVAAWGDRLKPGMRVIAVSKDLLELGLKRGTEVEISGLRGRYTVLDRTHGRWRRKIDIYMGKDVAAALKFGRRKVEISW